MIIFIKIQTLYAYKIKSCFNDCISILIELNNLIN